MSKLIDLTGQRSGRLLITRRAPDHVNESGRKASRWYSDCDCGTKDFIVFGNNFRRGLTKSCGCLRTEMLVKRSVKENRYDLSGNYGIGYDSNDREFYFDLEDYDKIKDYCWYVHSDGGVVTNNRNGNKTIKMHRLIMDVLDKPDIVIDHKKHVRHDNRKSELRATKHFENMVNMQIKSTNTSGCPGVSWHKTRKQWIARITFNKVVHFLGWFNDYDDAVKVRKEAEKKYFGEYSYDASMEIN